MVPRQKLEFLRGKWTDEIFQGEALLNHIKGKLEARLTDIEARPEDEQLHADVSALQKEFTQNMRMLDRVVGARQAVQMMIEECDLQEPSYEISEVTEISLG